MSNSNPVGQASLDSVSRPSGAPGPRSSTACPPGYIPLHNLCHNCKKMSKSLTILHGIRGRKARTWVLSHIDMQPGRSFWSSNYCHLCTHIINVIDKGNSRYSKPDQPQSNSKIMLQYDGYWITVKVGDMSTPMGEIYLSEFNLGVALSPEYPACLFSKYISTNNSDYDENLLRKWLWTCIHDHSECLTYQQKATTAEERPTRILQVGQDYVQLCQTAATDSQYLYATLSHIWGTDPSYQLTLTKNNVVELQGGVPITCLPKIFREAATLTRLLGLHYLWIDSMCIMQDSQSDWKHEANKMASIYSNAACNLAHPFPPNHTGLSYENPKTFLPCVLRTATESDPGLYVASSISVRTPILDHHNWRNTSQWPLSSRAWILQEQLLSPRTIFFGHHNLMWECAMETFDEHLSRVFVDAPSKWTLYNMVQSPDCMVDWETIINHYRSRQLTQARDRLTAFAGIARAAHEMTGMTYLAGLWSERLVESLLWSIRRDFSKGGCDEDILEAVVNTVPSWSWFSVPIDFQSTFAFPFVRQKSSPFQTQSVVYTSVLLSFQWPSCQQNKLPKYSYQNFEGLQIQVSTQTVASELVWEETVTLGAEIVEKLKAQHFVSNVDVYISIDLNHAADNVPSTVLLAALTEVQAIQTIGLGPRSSRRVLAGLILIPGDGMNTWKRVGMWILTVTSVAGHNSGEETPSFLSLLDSVREEDITLV